LTNSNLIFPEIETKRLRLSLLTLDDSDAIYKHFSDDSVTRFMDISPCKNINDAKEIIRFHIDDSGCRWGIYSKINFRLIGTCGFHSWVQGVRPRAEIGFDLAKEHWGKGFMQEALNPVMEFGFKHMGLVIIEANVEQENDRSIKLLEKTEIRKGTRVKRSASLFFLE